MGVAHVLPKGTCSEAHLLRENDIGDALGMREEK